MSAIAVEAEDDDSFLMVGVRGRFEAIVGGVAPALPMLAQTATKVDIAAIAKRLCFTFFRLF